jgi:eukaryotic-like serine/threonine-protein kinase
MRDALRMRRLAREVAEGRRVDWDRESGGTTSRWLEMLQVVETVRNVHREHARQAEAEMVDPATEPAPRAGADAQPAAPIGHWGHLDLLEHVGSGGFGDVYRAWDPTLQRAVALKLRTADGGGADRLLAEARALARLGHPNVLTIHGADVHDGKVGLWTDLVTGHTLEDLIRLIGPLEAQEAALIGIMLCRALAAVHARNLVHLDVKTTNVMRERGGRIVLLDFGTAHELAGGRAAEVGTPLVMAPELLFKEPVGPAADLYGLGVLLYRLVTLRYPIECDTVEELRERLTQGAATPLRDVRPELPAPFVRTVERALSRDPSWRQATAGAMERALGQVLGAMTPSEIMRVPKIPPKS